MKNSNAILFCFIFLGITVSGQEKSIPSVKPNAIPIIDSTSIAQDSVLLSKTNEMLDEEQYWSIIEKSLKEYTDQEDQELFLVSEIEKLTPKEIIGFRLRTDKLLFDTYNQELWCAAFIMNGGVSDGDFDYFRCWIISRGKDVFYKAKTNPDYLINEVIANKESYQFEGFWFVAVSAFKNSTGQELYPYIDYEQFLTNDENYPLLDFTWNVEEPKTMELICPVLFKNLWK
ncbi:DUF4240 domain-containing protein [Flavobacterium sp. W1B]|uniref:DUF4240 domain-containing protein n=1 Tax=Flavobacterium sp. W1B TaxID=3394146 RepID=UPI0039BC5CA9